MIAAQAEDLGLTVATRNTLDFPDVPTIHPRNEASPGDDAGALKHCPIEEPGSPTPATERAPAR